MLDVFDGPNVSIWFTVSTNYLVVMLLQSGSFYQSML